MLVFASGDFQMNREELDWLLSFFSFSNPAPIPSIIKPKLKKVVYFFIFYRRWKKHDENSYRKFSAGVIC